MGGKEKNQLIVENRTLQVLTFWNEELSPKDDSLLQRLEEAASLTGAAVLLASERAGEEEEVFFPQILSYFSFPVIALSFHRRLLRQTGCYNELLSGMIDFELLCRLICSNHSGKVYWSQIQDLRVLRKQDIYTLAYILRSYLEALKTTGELEEIYQRICSEAQKYNLLEDFLADVNKMLSEKEEYDNIRMNTAPFLVFRGDDTCADVLGCFAEELADELAKQGQAVRLWSGSRLEGDQVPDLCRGLVGFQAPVLLSLGLEKVKGKRFQFWLDYPAPFGQYFPDNREDYYVLCQDGNHAKFIREYFGVANAMHFPPGGMESKNIAKERPYDIVFIGSYFSEESVLEDPFSKEFYEYMLENPGKTFDRGLWDLLARKNVVPGKEEFLQKLIGLRKVYRSVIGYFRRKVIDTILEAGYTIHVYGDSWKAFSSSHREQLVLHPEVQAKEALEELGKAKIGLNIMSWHKDGMTERVANIMLSGAVCLTEETDYIRKHLKEGEEVVTFSLENLARLPGKIRLLLQDEGLRESISKQGFCKAKEELSWEAKAKELIRMTENEERIGVFVATHVKFDPPANPTYIPLQVGSEGKEDLGYVRDNVGEHISDLNYLFGELTGLFWIWQNITQFDYIGLCHYRRYFLNKDMKLMQRDEYLSLLDEYDVIVPIHGTCKKSYYEHYGDAHDAKYLDVIGEVIEKVTPEYRESYQRAMEGHIFFSGNLMVTSSEILKGYSEWLFTVFTEAMDRIDVSGYDDYHKRIYGFLSEQMLYVYMMKNNLTYVEVPVGISEEKAETKELKQAVKTMMEAGKYKEALDLFENTLRRRPDLLLKGSDLYGELQAVYQELRSKV